MNLVLKVDRECHIIDIDQTGPFTRDEVIGTCCGTYITPDSYTCLKEAVHTVFDTGYDRVFQTQSEALGTTRYYENRAYLATPPEGVSYVTIVAHDITDEVILSKEEEERGRFLEDVTKTVMELLVDYNKKYPETETGDRKKNGYKSTMEKLTDTNEKVTQMQTGLATLLDPQVGVFPRLQAVESFRRTTVWAVGALYGAGVTALANLIFGIL